MVGLGDRRDGLYHTVTLMVSVMDSQMVIGLAGCFINAYVTTSDQWPGTVEKHPFRSDWEL